MTTNVTTQEAKRVAYKRGTRFLKLRYQRSGEPFDEPVKVSKKPIAKRIEAELTLAYDISVKEMRTAVSFAHAVHKMVATCGPKARKILLDCKYDAKKIVSFANTAPTRRIYELGEIAAGRRPLVKPKSGIPVLDTERFSEVSNRLARARGLINATLSRLQLLTCSSKGKATDCQRFINKLDEVISNSEELRTLVDDYGVMPRKVDKKHSIQKSPKRPTTLREACRGNAAALGLIEKNVRDIPRLPKSVKPNREDVFLIRQELAAIMKAAKAERKLLKALARTAR